MIITSYMNAFREECRKMDPIRDTFEKITTKTADQFTMLSPHLTDQHQEEMKKIYSEELAEAKLRAQSGKI